MISVNPAALPVNDTSAATKGAILISEIRARDLKNRGVVYPGEVATGHRAEVIPGKSIRLFGTCPEGVLQVGPAGAKVSNEEFAYSHEFSVGDEVIVGRGAFAFFGPITAITTSTITVINTGRSARLTIEQFDRLNWHHTVEGEKIERGLWRD